MRSASVKLNLSRDNVREVFYKCILLQQKVCWSRYCVIIRTYNNRLFNCMKKIINIKLGGKLKWKKLILLTN